MIITTTTPSDFWRWLQSSETYKYNFSYNGAIALFQYLDELSDDLDSPYEFDPVAWCCEYSEYENINDYNKQHGTDYALGLDDTDRPDITDETTVIDFDGGIIVQEF